MMKRSKTVFTVAMVLSTWFVTVSNAQQKTIKDGVFTQAQATSGQQAYDANCKACHDMKFYRDIWIAWQEKPLLNFWYIIVAEMPSDNPGSLFDAEYTDIVAYILSQMGFPSGDTALDPNNDMDNIIIVAP